MASTQTFPTWIQQKTTPLGTDVVLIADVENGNAMKYATLSSVTAVASGNMNTSTYDPAGIAQQLVGTTAVQVVTNKDLTSGTNTFPTLNQNTTGTASNVTGTVSIANGGTGATTQQAALNAITGSSLAGTFLQNNGTNATWGALPDTTVTSRLLTGYVSGVGTISASDSILSAIQKLNGNIAWVAGNMNTSTYDPAGIAQQLVGTTATQTISNKTIGDTNTISVKASGFTLQDSTDTTKTAFFNLSLISASTGQSISVPNRSIQLDTITTSTATPLSGILIGNASTISTAVAGTNYTSPTGTENLSNKTITASTYNGVNLTTAGGTTNFLRADGTYAAPSWTGTVTSVSVTTANGVSGTVATSTTTPAITLTLGGITPTSVNGIQVGQGLTLSAGNTGVGVATLPSSTGTANTAIGNSALTSLVAGNHNTAIGYQALLQVSGSDNTSVGYNSLYSNLTGSGNVSIGAHAGFYETNSNAFYVDNQDRTNTAGDKAGALLYGTFNATASSQTLAVNGVLSSPYVSTVNTSGYSGALKSATTTVNVSSATAPTSGQVLTATSGTAATWQTPSGGTPTFDTQTIWLPTITTSYVSGTQITFTSSSATQARIDANGLTSRICTWTDSTGATQKRGFVNLATASSTTVTLNLYGDTFVSTDINFRVTVPWITVLEDDWYIPGAQVADSTNPVGKQWINNEGQTIRILGFDAYVGTAAAGTGAALTYNVYDNGSTALITSAPSFGTNTSVLNSQATAQQTVANGHRITLRTPSSAGTTNVASDLNVCMYFVPDSLFSAF